MKVFVCLKFGGVFQYDRSMSVFALLTLLASSSELGQAQDLVFTNARIVVSPGNVIDSGSIRVRDGKIVDVRKGAAAAGGQVVDASGMTIYAAFIHTAVSENISGVSPERTARPSSGSAEERRAQEERDKDPFNVSGNFRLAKSVAEAEKLEVDSLEGLAKQGFGTVVLGANGGIIGAQPATVNTGTKVATGVKAVDVVPISLGGRSFGGYPGSTMGTIAFIRQSLADGLDYSGEDAGFKRLNQATQGAVPTLFDNLNEVSFFQAKRISEEFGLRPIYSFRSDAGAVRQHLKGATVMLQGSLPTKPRLGENLDGVSLSGVRDYFKAVQVGAELEKSKIDFVYVPGSSTVPFEGIRTYVRGGLSRKAALAAMTVNPAKVLGIDRDLGTVERGKRANLVMVQGDILDSTSQVMATYIDGKAVDFEMPKKKDAKDLKPDELFKYPAANYEFFPAPAERKQAFRLYRNATVWTQGPMGTVSGCDVLVRDGKFVAVGKGLNAPRGCEVIDATGKHISPGLWDAHSHTAISGGVNEFSNMITAECRIRDVVNHTDSSVYTQLSGGTVGAMQLHGSANAIGGQSNTVKWRWGMEPDDYAVKGAPEGVKFALGQNPIREEEGTNGSTLLTFRPRTRMGVEEAIRKALQLGKEYNQAWDDFNSGKRKEKPRRDLQLEALGEIVSQKRWVHSHAYRADEMLMLIRVTKEFGPKLATLQHVLEGYKIADEMAEMGVGGSTFSDWWGFKLESYDAIPHNAALMAQRGVVVSVNSDSNNHARRMNQEAAKSMRFGGASAEMALGFVTTGPTKQLGIDQWSGSIEPGKDADMVLWTHEPMSIKAIALETYVDGIKRFDRKNDAAQRVARQKELEAARDVLGEPNTPFGTGGDAEKAEAKPADMTPTKARFGLATVDGQPGTARYPRGATLIQGATIHPMSGEPFVGDLLLGSDGKIEQVGTGLSPKGADVVDGSGKHVYPGLIDPATGLGMNEIGQVPASDDSSERGNFHPDYKPERSMNPEWDSIAVARHQGVLTAIVKPSGGGIPGQAALIHTEGYTWEDMTIQSGAALMYSIGGGGGRFGDGRTDQVRCCELDLTGGHDHDAHEEENHDAEFMAGLPAVVQGSPARLNSLSESLKGAKEYREKRAGATPDAPVARDQAMDAMLEVVDGKMPVMISVTTATEIQSAVAWAEENEIKVVLYGCGGAGEIAEWLAAKQVPVILAAVYGQPRADQPLDYFYGLPGRLAAAGVKFGLTTNDNHDVRQLRDQAGWAATYGLGSENAARSITYWTAQILGIDDRLGSIRTGMDGTVILTDGEITETSTNVLRAWIQSREVPLENRQTRFWDKYRFRPLPVRG